MSPNERVDRSKVSPEWQELLDAASNVRASAHAPYSGYAVGAAVRTKSGAVYAGANIENASYGLTVCAERVAIWNAVSHGETALDALAVVTEDGGTPCGACRQVMREFADELPVAIADGSGSVWLTSLGQLLPHAFTPDSLDSRTK